MKHVKQLLMVSLLGVFLMTSTPLQADPYAALPGDGVTANMCDVTSWADVDSRGVIPDSCLRDRIELYNDIRLDDQGPFGGCFFLIYFAYKNRPITLTSPLVLENVKRSGNPDGSSYPTGTYIMGYGEDGKKIGITINALNLTKDATKCAFFVEGGFAARQQIHGIDIEVQRANQAICDERGRDLMSAISPNCSGSKTGAQCDFSDVTILTNAASGSGGVRGINCARFPSLPACRSVGNIGDTEGDSLGAAGVSGSGGSGGAGSSSSSGGSGGVSGMGGSSASSGSGGASGSSATGGGGSAGSTGASSSSPSPSSSAAPAQDEGIWGCMVVPTNRE